MLDFGKLVQRFEEQVHARRGAFRRDMQRYAAVSFRIRGDQVYLPPFANVDDVLVLTQVQRTDRERQPGRIFTDIDTFTSQVAVENGHLIVGSKILRHRNLGRRPQYQPSTASFCASESASLFEALELDYAREATCRAVADGGFASQTVAIPQLMAMVEHVPDSMRTIPIPPSVSGLPYFLIQKAELRPEMGEPLGWYLDMRAWRGRQFDNELWICMPEIDNPLRAIVAGLFPSGLENPNLMELPEAKQQALVEAVDAQLPDMPDTMLTRAMVNYLNPIRVVPGYAVSLPDSLAAARRHLGLYSQSATDADILAALGNPESPMYLSAAPAVRTFHWMRNEDRFIGGEYDFQFVWDVAPGKRATTLAADKPRGRQHSGRKRGHGKRGQEPHPQGVQDVARDIAGPSLPDHGKAPKTKRSKPSKRARLARRRAAAAAAETAPQGNLEENTTTTSPVAELVAVSEQFAVEASAPESRELVGVGCESDAVVSPADQGASS